MVPIEVGQAAKADLRRHVVPKVFGGPGLGPIGPRSQENIHGTNVAFAQPRRDRGLLCKERGRCVPIHKVVANCQSLYNVPDGLGNVKVQLPHQTRTQWVRNIVQIIGNHEDARGGDGRPGTGRTLQLEDGALISASLVEAKFVDGRVPSKVKLLTINRRNGLNRCRARRIREQDEVSRLNGNPGFR